MSKIFYLSEIVKFAVEKERQAYELYKMLHDASASEESKKLFSYLMEQELQHEKFYEAMLGGVTEEQSPNVKEDNEYTAYIDELIDASRKIAPYQDLDFNDLNSVLDYAMAREKDSILFYVGLKNLAPKATHDHIDQIITEEEKHLVILSKLKK
ncbi:MAG: ferritin family protein [Gammaproteobacteria bacterium]|nr:ferritin family protein [Gammaproteobacteria bacterium]